MLFCCQVAVPGAAAFVLRPLAVDRTEVVCELLFAPDEAAKDSFDPSDAEAAFSNGVFVGIGRTYSFRPW